MIDRMPIMRLGTNVLVSLRGDMDDATVVAVENAVMQEIASRRTTGALIDVGGLAIVDSFIARVIARMAAMTRLLGAETAVVGIQPAVAITLVEMGVAMTQLNTALNAEQGLALLERLAADDGESSAASALEGTR